MSHPSTDRDERVREQFHECPMCCYDCDCTQGSAGGLCLHCNDPLSAEIETKDVSAIANDAATRMRDRCVEKLRSTAEEWMREGKENNKLSLVYKSHVINEAAELLQSLEQEK